ncbi:putative serine/threonine protein kinase (ISS) [Planoprotostelium fungivorum]|uniref:Putative serine/threonine protein kinase (ISS) n=1 Tax=Planoprotostelium fungivorum TaxID=1890364 RepID=A0A2P6NGD2_9EUKA|nr:putative serine/threonine protein kinase (ISS) [Planoprotostelium fungivorum]
MGSALVRQAVASALGECAQGIPTCVQVKDKWIVFKDGFKVVLWFSSNNIICGVASFDLHIPEPCRAKVARVINEFNPTGGGHNIEMDFDDGQVRLSVNSLVPMPADPDVYRFLAKSVVDGLITAAQVLARSISGWILNLEDSAEAPAAPRPLSPPRNVPVNEAKILPDLSRDADPSDLTDKVEIGRGGFGIVYRCNWRGTTVAVKEFPPARDGVDEECQKEFQTMMGLAHPNIVRVFTGNMDPPYIVMEYYGGGSLEDKIHGDGRAEYEIWPLKKKLQAGMDIANGLIYLHVDKKAVHQDLKPGNIMLNTGGSCVIVDFGLTRFRNAVTSTATVIQGQGGTLLYMAPEAFDQEISSASDIYSLGVILWEILSGCVPYREYANIMAVFKAVAVEGKRPPLPSGDHTTSAVNQLMEKMWDKDPRSRPTAAEVSKTLKAEINTL